MCCTRRGPSEVLAVLTLRELPEPFPASCQRWRRCTSLWQCFVVLSLAMLSQEV